MRGRLVGAQPGDTGCSLRLHQGDAVGKHLHLVGDFGVFENGNDAGAHPCGDQGVEGEDGGEVGKKRGPGCVVEEAGDQHGNQGRGSEGEGDANGGVKCGRHFDKPRVELGGGDLAETGDSEESDLFAECSEGSEFLHGLLAGDGLHMGGGVKEEAGEAALSDAGAHGGEQAEEGVGAEDVEVVIVEVGGGTELFAGDGRIEAGSHRRGRDCDRGTRAAAGCG